MPPDLNPADLSHPQLKSLAEDEGKLQLGTLGGGNHFVEMQTDDDGRLWLMIHSGSRAMGQAIKSQHLAKATIRSAAMSALDADTLAGQAYLHDQNWARRYASANRLAMMTQVIAILRSQFNVEPVEGSLIACDHHHVSQEEQLGQTLLIHRKGAMPASDGLAGVVPGSMGTMSFHVEGRGCPQSLMSSAHGAGRLFSRHTARERFNRADLRQQMQNVWFDPRLSESLREESPKSYKDVQAVMRAQSELVKIRRKLRPVLVYKAR
jgi:tRNA-splicing ligase RtcB (3'-phosphate/5'-hydroxy nucleic acid ligase)